MRSEVRGITLLAAVLVGCGDPLVGADYLGEPLAVVDGQVILEDDRGDIDWSKLHVSLFWSGGSSVDRRSEQQVVVETQFPALYTITVYTPPPERVLHPVGDGSASVALGMPLLYLDEDADQRWDPATERVLGGALDAILVYTTAPLEADVLKPSAKDVGFYGGWFPGLLGGNGLDVERQRLPAGFHSALSYNGLCELEQGEMPAVLQPGDPVDLLVGDWWDSLVDYDCDGTFNEWYGMCPSQWDMAELCQQPEVFMHDPWLSSCLDLCG